MSLQRHNIYNLFHNYTLPAVLAAYGVLGGNTLAVSLALIWFAHIGMDRLLGYGLKYADSFGDAINAILSTVKPWLSVGSPARASAVTGPPKL